MKVIDSTFKNQTFIRLVRAIVRSLAYFIFYLKFVGFLNDYMVKRHVKKNNGNVLTRFKSNHVNLKNEKEIKHEVAKNGYSIAGELSDSSVKELNNLVDEVLDVNENKAIIDEEIKEPHLKFRVVDEILHSEAIYKALREYLMVDNPILYRSRLRVRKDNIEDDVYSCQEGFHYDVVDYKSVTVFIYLSDVDKHSSPHVVIKGSHKAPIYKKIFNRILSIEEAKKSYGENITPLLGKAGSIIFENLLCYHKRSFGNKKRVIIIANYSIGRRRSEKFKTIKGFIKFKES